jgi:hypothetical protein
MNKVKFVITKSGDRETTVYEGTADSFGFERDSLEESIETFRSMDPGVTLGSPRVTATLDNVGYFIATRTDNSVKKHDVNFSATMLVDDLTPNTVHSAGQAAGVPGDTKFTVETVSDWNDEAFNYAPATPKHRITFNWSN